MNEKLENYKSLSNCYYKKSTTYFRKGSLKNVKTFQETKYNHKCAIIYWISFCFAVFYDRIQDHLIIFLILSNNCIDKVYLEKIRQTFKCEKDNSILIISMLVT